MRPLLALRRPERRVDLTGQRSILGRSSATPAKAIAPGARTQEASISNTSLAERLRNTLSQRTDDDRLVRHRFRTDTRNSAVEDPANCYRLGVSEAPYTSSV